MTMLPFRGRCHTCGHDHDAEDQRLRDVLDIFKQAGTEQRPLEAEAQQPAQAFGIIDPDYARVFTQARILAWQYGYACLAHGSFTRDLDLLLVPWTDAAQADDVDYFAPRIADAAGLTVSPHPPSARQHGRKTWTLLFPGFADPRWVDLSVLTPNVRHEQRARTD